MSEIAMSAPTQKRRRLRQKTADPEAAQWGALPTGVTRNAADKMASLGLPMAFIMSAFRYLDAVGVSNLLRFGGAEFCAGCKSLTMSFVQMGHRFTTFEKEDSSITENIMDVNGFLWALNVVRCIRPGGVQHWAPPCSSWVWVNRSTSTRSKENPLGECPRGYVLEANVFVDRMVLLLLVGLALNIHFIVEQPASSLLWLHPAWKHMQELEKLGWIPCHRQPIWMGMFGGPSPKATTLQSSCAWINCMATKLDRSRFQQPSKNVKSYVDAQGKKRITGEKELKQSQAYPAGYGRVICKLWAENDDRDRKDLVEPCEEYPSHDWDRTIEAELNALWADV